MTLLQQLKPYIDAAQVAGLIIREDESSGSVSLDHIIIEAEASERESIGGRKISLTHYTVSYVVSIGGTREDPPDVDVCEIGSTPSLGEAVRMALAAVIQARVEAYQDRLADAEMANAFLAEDALDVALLPVYKGPCPVSSLTRPSPKPSKRAPSR